MLDVLGFEPDSHGEAMWDSLRDLKRFGLVDPQSRNDIRISQEARKIRVASLRTTWPGIHETWLDDRQARFLGKLCELSEQRGEDSANLAEIHGDEVLAAIGETPNEAIPSPSSTHWNRSGLVDASAMTLGNFLAFPTYSGMVLATEKAATEGQKLVADLLDDWETTNTEFKRELHLGTKDEKAEFIRDVLALANPQVSGDRHLITGFDDKSRDFTTAADPKITQDTIENLLNEYTKPPVAVIYTNFTEQNGAGDIGVLRVLRDRTKVPYRVARRLAGEKKAIAEGEVYVRHGSHVANASVEEIADLEGEARRALADA